MNSLKIKKEIIRYSKLLNTTNLSPLRSGNISVRYKNGFFITPSGKKYSSLRSSDIVFVSLEGRHIKNITLHRNGGSTEIYIRQKNTQDQLFIVTHIMP